MRKGRARRRSKGSRPSIPVESRAKSAELQAGQVASGPRIVSGVTRASDAPPPAGEATENAPVVETLARGEAEVPTARSAEVTSVASIASVESDAAEAAEAVEAAGLVLAAATEPAPELGTTSESAGASAEEEDPASADEVSIPPVGDLVVEEFFSEGDVGKHLRAEAELEEAVVDAKIARKHAPEVVQRRTRLARYVTWAVAGAGALCLAALARGVVAPHGAAVANANATSAMVATNAEPAAKEAAKPEPAPAAEPPAPAAEPPAAVATAGEPAPAAAPAEAKEPAKAEAPEAKPEAAKADAPAEATTPDPKASAAEKNKSRAALEGGRLAAAIEAGEKAVALDPTDGEAWLLLGAAYQEKGANADARRCYAACVKQGKRGPIGECSAMLR